MAEFKFFLDENRETGKVIPLHYHDYYELVYYRDGNGQSEYQQQKEMPYPDGEFLKAYSFKLDNGEVFNFGRNSLAIYSPYTIHNEKHNITGKVLCVGFLLDKKMKLPNMFFQSAPSELVKWIEKIYEEYDNKQENYFLAINAFLDLIVTYISRLDNKKIAVVKNSLYNEKNYIDNYYMTDITVRQLASMAAYSVDHFTRLFQKEFGIKPKTYICNLRLKRAEELLKNSDITVSEIAAQVGFNDAAQFSVAYKQKFGYSPTKNRNAAANVPENKEEK